MHTLLLWLRDTQVAHLSPLTPPAAPSHCPSCQHPQPYRWGTRTRTVPDLQGTLTVIVQRYRCRACQRTWSVTPGGLTARAAPSGCSSGTGYCGRGAVRCAGLGGWNGLRGVGAVRGGRSGGMSDGKHGVWDGRPPRTRRRTGWGWTASTGAIGVGSSPRCRRLRGSGWAGGGGRRRRLRTRKGG